MCVGTVVCQYSKILGRPWFNYSFYLTTCDSVCTMLSLCLCGHILVAVFVAYCVMLLTNRLANVFTSLTTSKTNFTGQIESQIDITNSIYVAKELFFLTNLCFVFWFFLNNQTLFSYILSFQGFGRPVTMEDDVVSMETAQADGKVLPEGGEALIQGAAIAQQGEVAGNMEMMVMDALDPTLLQMKTEVLDGGGTVTVTGGDEGQIITLQVCINIACVGL